MSSKEEDEGFPHGTTEKDDKGRLKELDQEEIDDDENWTDEDEGDRMLEQIIKNRVTVPSLVNHQKNKKKKHVSLESEYVYLNIYGDGRVTLKKFKVKYLCWKSTIVTKTPYLIKIFIYVQLHVMNETELLLENVTRELLNHPKMLLEAKTLLEKFERGILKLMSVLW